MTGAASAPNTYRRLICDLDYVQWQRVSEGLCCSEGCDNVPLPDRFQCARCSGLPEAPPRPTPPPRPRPRIVPQSPPEPVAEALKTATLDEIAARPEVDRAWLVPDLLPADGLSLWVSPPKAGKSTLARCLATVCAGGGGDWLGFKAKGGPVLHLALEERPGTVREHYAALEADGSRIHLLDQKPPENGLRFAALALAMQRVKPVVTIIDTLARWIRVDDLNDYAKTSAALDPYVHLAREHSAHVILIHHSRKSGGEHGAEALGSTALAGSVDTILSIRRQENRRTLYAEGRDGVSLEEVVLTMDPQTQWISSGKTVSEAASDDLEHEIMQYLRERGEPLRASEIQSDLGKRKASVLAALRRLSEAGRVEVVDVPGKGRGRAYAATPLRFPVPGSRTGTGNRNGAAADESSLFITDDDVPF